MRAAFAPIFLRQKSTNLKFKYEKAAHKTFVQKRSAENVGEIDQRWKTVLDVLQYVMKNFLSFTEDDR
jgi:hypothetical protein